ncbi:Na/Pi cotransporter family protein [Laribacter hongkongensis]|uniref:Na/Pi cotransporter family protein n=1 Tax=Laribacter hongkongensis TaxID=168471 RepID=UPI001EFC2E29|nr:Na/Pi cotransporter family protein [Laribacter hongkongensis]MCG9075619.1 Na/Pi cotransporter family protein [Laribacter hongkongensis]
MMGFNLMIAGFVGGLGLFMLGMGQMTDGLKGLAGGALKTILASFTNNRPKALLVGAGLTALVQSSSAITVAAIGFINAGLLTLPQAIWVIFGSNIGTTLTGWLVALIGLKVKIELFALPAIGIGMAMHMAGGKSRWGAGGLALAGFGVFFLGIHLLQNAFTGVSAYIDFNQFGTGTVLGDLVYVGLGFLLTLCVQSSSAAMALALTAAASGTIGLEAAAAVVIGANVGTTSTAILAVIKATPNARRVAAAHVFFNVLTGVVALLILPTVLELVKRVSEALSLDPSVATTLALFHTLFNCLGVLLMWPLAGGMIRVLLRLFKSQDEELARPQHLDDSLLDAPELALEAVRKELVRQGDMALEIARHHVLGARIPHPVAALEAAVPRLGADIRSFAFRLHRMAESVDDNTLQRIVRSSHHYERMAIRAESLPRAIRTTSCTEVNQALGVFRGLLDRLCAELDTSQPDFVLDTTETLFQSLREEYRMLKFHLLAAVSAQKLPIEIMEALMARSEGKMTSLESGLKAARRLSQLRGLPASVL